VHGAELGVLGGGGQAGLVGDMVGLGRVEGMELMVHSQNRKTRIELICRPIRPSVILPRFCKGIIIVDPILSQRRIPRHSMFRPIFYQLIPSSVHIYSIPAPVILIGFKYKIANVPLLLRKTDIIQF